MLSFSKPIGTLTKLQFGFQLVFMGTIRTTLLGIVRVSFCSWRHLEVVCYWKVTQVTRFPKCHILLNLISPSRNIANFPNLVQLELYRACVHYTRNIQVYVNE